MRFFKRAPAPFIDRSRGNAAVGELQARLDAGDWATIEGALDAVTGEQREFLVEALTEGGDRVPWMDAWVQARPDSGTGRLMWGAQATQWAWLARSSAPASDVEAERWKPFFERLEMAEEQLQHAAAMNPRDSAPWVGLTWSGLGRSITHAEATQRWMELAERNPATEMGAAARLSYLSAKWCGSHELMWEFINERVGQAGPGSPLWFLVPMGHIEHWLADRMSGDSPVHASRYFSQPHVQDQVRAAYSNYLDSPQKGSSPNEHRHRELFACCFYLMGDRAMLKREVEKIGLGISRSPWGYLGSPLVAYASILEAASAS
jgi:hypothetical protein